MRVEQYPDLLALRDGTGRCLGLFSDLGSWLTLTWGESAWLEARNTRDDEHYFIDAGVAFRKRVMYADRLEAELADGRLVRVGYLARDTLFVEHAGPLLSDLPSRRVDRGTVLGEALNQEPAGDFFETRRAEWNQRFQKAESVSGRVRTELDRLLLARAITTLAWNYRAPVDELRHGGCIPSPFAYNGFWGWDSWKHARALARIEPEWAQEQLRAQLYRQRADGMVPDTVRIAADDDNWSNTKPALCAQALEALFRATGDADLVRELLPFCERFQHFFDQQRRTSGGILHQPGGLDHETATWDTGWDLSARFDRIPLVPHGDWQLLDLLPADLNAYHLMEQRALARLAQGAGADPSGWSSRAAQQDSALRELFDPALGAFCDRRPDGRSTSILSAAAWLPVSAGAADSAQTAQVRRHLLDPDRFATPFPFPTLAATEPAFNPDGYWNGSVWLDHAALALAVLGEPGAELRSRLLDQVARHATLYECYSPVTGDPTHGSRPAVPQFSWSAAALLELLS